MSKRLITVEGWIVTNSEDQTRETVMYKLCYMSNRWLAVGIDEDKLIARHYAEDDILPLVLDGNPVLIVEELDDLPSTIKDTVEVVTD